MGDSPNLELVPLDDLLDELENRFDNLICIGLKMPSDGNMETIYRVSGSRYECLGLCEELKDRVKDTFESFEEEEDIEFGYDKGD